MEAKSVMRKVNAIPNTWLEGVGDDDETTRPGDWRLVDGSIGCSSAGVCNLDSFPLPFLSANKIAVVFDFHSVSERHAF